MGISSSDVITVVTSLSLCIAIGASPRLRIRYGHAADRFQDLGRLLRLRTHCGQWHATEAKDPTAVTSLRLSTSIRIHWMLHRSSESYEGY